MMKRIALTFAVFGALAISGSAEETGFTTLFNGKDLTGWKHGGNWSVGEDGSIGRQGKGGSLVYTEAKVPDDFELRFEWKVAEGSNSGIYYRPTQYEYQILDNGKHPDGKNSRTSAASLYFCMQPSHDATNSVGEWNSGRIVCKGTVVQHWLNGKKVIDFDYADKEYAFHVELLKKRGGNLEARGANLSLQDHGDPVWYRNLRWRALTEKDELDKAPVTPEELAPEVLEAEAKKLEGIIKRREEAAKKKK
ncbi:MAG: hypothetical protein ACI8UO_000556 [Verrucomicrobiales bacterium]|jgi:hypothetical protein